MYVFFKRLAVSCKYTGKKLPRILPQRWTSHFNAAETLKNNFTDVILCLFEVASLSIPESVEAEGLLNRASTIQFTFVLAVTSKLLNVLQPLNNFFESTYTDIGSAMRMLASTSRTLKSLRTEMIFKELISEAENIIKNTEIIDDNFLYFKQRSRRVPISLHKDYLFTDEGAASMATTNSSTNNYTMFQRILFNSIDTSVNEINNRFAERSLSIVTATFCLLFERSRTEVKCNTIKQLLKDNSHINNLNAELMVLHNGLLKQEYNTLIELAKDFSPNRKAFPSFSSILDIALTLPVSTARPECCFSTVKKILSPHRVSMDFNRKSYLVLLGFNKDLTATIDFESLIDRFAKASRRLILT